MSESAHPGQDPWETHPNSPDTVNGQPVRDSSAYRPSQVFARDAAQRAEAHGSAYATHAPNFQQANTSVQPPAAAVQAAAKPSGGWVKAIVAGVIGAVLATFITLGATGALTTPSGDDGAAQQATTQIGGSGTTITVSGEDSTLAEAVAEKTLPSVVCIYVYTQQQAQMGPFGQQTAGGSEELTSLGSGVILTEDGYIITNYHVIEGESSLKVSVNGGQYDAEVVGTDESSDLAVIKVEGAGDLTPIEVGSSADLVVGEWVMTVGSPYGMEQSVAAGIVSAVDRTSESLQSDESTAIYTNLIQTDAAINPGNSGGALVNSAGQLVGINTLTASYSGSNSGVGFAIPSDYAISIANEIIAGEEPSHALLGVSVVTIDSETAARYGLSADAGAYVAAVSGGAEEAGIEEGDIITKIDDTNVTSANDVILAVRSKSPGDVVNVEVNRDGETQAMEVTLGSDTGGSSGDDEGSSGD